MKFASIGHLIDAQSIKKIPEEWIKKKYIISPEINVNGTKGHIFALKLTAKQIMSSNKNEIREEILNCILYAQDSYDINLIQLGALTTSVTNGGKWVLEQDKYTGYTNHGNSYTAAISYQTVLNSLKTFNISSTESKIAIIGAYGIIGEALSTMLYPLFKETLLIGRREEKLKELQNRLSGNIEISTNIQTEKSDVIVTATSHPSSLLKSNHLKKNAIIVDISQPPNISKNVCLIRKDIHRIDGGLVNWNLNIEMPILAKGKILSCIAEVIMQALEDDRNNYVGSIDFCHLQRTVEWGKKYGFTLNELTNFGMPLKSSI